MYSEIVGDRWGNVHFHRVSPLMGDDDGVLGWPESDNVLSYLQWKSHEDDTALTSSPSPPTNERSKSGIASHASDQSHSKLGDENRRSMNTHHHSSSHRGVQLNSMSTARTAGTAQIQRVERASKSPRFVAGYHCQTRDLHRDIFFSARRTLTRSKQQLSCSPVVLGQKQPGAAAGGSTEI